ncbi:hypothetical protein KJ785_03830 [Patescibacteria group bacterium]|nr:hypothetical protein [Patescibacteria group bacterium]
MLTLRKRIYIIVSSLIALVLVLLLLYFFVFNKPKDILVEQEITQKTDIENKSESGSSNKANVSVKIQPQESTKVIIENSQELYIKQLTTIFVERFSSYSNQNQNQHLEDVLILVTDSMANWIKLQILEPGDSYEGVTTKVISSKISELNEQEAIVLVDVQQLIQKKNEQKVEYKSGRVNLKKINEEWKVAGLYWE